jgi:hypothetical protein
MLLCHSGDQEVSLYSSEGQLLARAAKDGWSFRVLGSAHDDSAIFVRAVIGGGQMEEYCIPG